MKQGLFYYCLKLTHDECWHKENMEGVEER